MFLNLKIIWRIFGKWKIGVEKLVIIPASYCHWQTLWQTLKICTESHMIDIMMLHSSLKSFQTPFVCFHCKGCIQVYCETMWAQNPNATPAPVQAHTMLNDPNIPCTPQGYTVVDSDMHGWEVEDQSLVVRVGIEFHHLVGCFEGLGGAANVGSTSVVISFHFWDGEDWLGIKWSIVKSSNDWEKFRGEGACVLEKSVVCVTSRLLIIT